MPRRAKRRSRERKVARRGMGWLWPAQPCGLPYDKFRTGYRPRELYKAAYEWLAYRKNDRGQSFAPSDKKIKAQMGYIKRVMFEEYQRSCDIEQRGGPPVRTWDSCRKVCKVRSNACGKSCVSKKKKCKKLPPSEGICNITDFQQNLSLETAAAEHWEDRRARGEAMPDEGDTSFDFVVEAPAPTVPVDDDIDFGYDPDPVTRYGKAVRGLGRLTPAQKYQYAMRRLVAPGEALDRIRARHGVGLEPRLPSHIAPYADFMAESAAVEVTPRRLAKAYVITRSSVRRQGRKAATVCETFPGYRELRRDAVERGEEVRPEDAMSVLLQTEDGKAYLDAAERGTFAAAPAKRMVKKLRCFGLSAGLFSDLKAAVKVAHNDEVRSALRSSSPAEWLALVDSKAVPGIGPAKAGFIASLLGRGDVPTFDAREIQLWRRKGTMDPQQHDVLALRDKIANVPLELDPRHEPYRQHLVHHALWDAYAADAPTSTTHQEVISAMRLAGGRGGAAANRGKYKPLPPGAGAIDQVRALEKARADIIRAVESGRFELCEKGVARTAARPPIDSVTHGQRTASEIEAVRRRYDRGTW